MATYNYRGEEVTGKRVLLVDKSFGDLDESGEIIYHRYHYPKVKWPAEDAHRDSYGFDKHADYGGNHVCRVILPMGTVLCRYGREEGSFTTNKGTPYELLGLPYIKETIEYHEYEVISSDVMVACEVTKGLVAPAFKSRGGVVQYKHDNPIKDELADGKLREVFLWKQWNESV